MSVSVTDRFKFESRQDLKVVLDRSPLAHVNLELTGSTYHGDGKIPTVYAFGEANLHAFTHEAAHMLDFFLRGKLDRLAMRGFGFSYPQEFFYDRYCNVPSATYAMHTELRATAIQAHLLEMIGFAPEMTSRMILKDMAVTLIGHMEDVYLIPERTGRLRMMRKQADRSNKALERAITERRAKTDPEQANEAKQALSEAVEQNNEISAAMHIAVNANRSEYANKHLTKYYGRYSKPELLEAWSLLMDWIPDGIAEQERIMKENEGILERVA